jgi:hypothetical protein
MAQQLKPGRSDNRGGKREKAGRPVLGNVSYQRKMPKSFIPLMDKYLQYLKELKNYENG